jgi:myosin heavy subunit
MLFDQGGSLPPNQNHGHEETDRSQRTKAHLLFLHLPDGFLDSEAQSATKEHRNSVCSKQHSPTAIMPSSTTDTDISNSPRHSDAYEHQTVKIEHKVKVAHNKFGTARKLTKPLVAAIATVLLLTTGSAAYFFSEFLTIPGLKTQVDRLEGQIAELQLQVNELETQVDRLKGQVDRLDREVDRLSNATDRLSQVNDELEQNVHNYAVENDRLNASVSFFAKLNTKLNSTVEELSNEVNDFKNENEFLVEINQGLNLTVTELSDKVQELDVFNDQLLKANSNLSKSVDHLVNETAKLAMMNEALNDTATDLRNEISSLSSEVDRLDRLTINLKNLVSFLNETALNIDESFDSMTDFLSKQIESNRVLVMETLENLYRQRISNWDCDFREFFLSEFFVSNRDAPIGIDLYPKAIGYIEERVLSDLCLNTVDFEGFLEEFMKLTKTSDASFNQLQQAAGQYTGLAVNYYFSPSAVTNSTTSVQWAEANYNCNNLPPESLFHYSTNPVIQRVNVSELS